MCVIKVSVIMVSVIMVSVIMVSVIMASVIMVSVIMTSVIMASIIVVSVIMASVYGKCHYDECHGTLAGVCIVFMTTRLTTFLSRPSLEHVRPKCDLCCIPAFNIEFFFLLHSSLSLAAA